MLARRFAIVCLLTMLFAMGFARIVAQSSENPAMWRGNLPTSCAAYATGCRAAAGGLVRLAFRPGPAASTLDSAYGVKSGRARTCRGPGSGLARGRVQSADRRRRSRPGPPARARGTSRTARTTGGRQS